MDLRESALIEVAGHNLNQWAKKGPNFRFFPSFIAKNGQKNPRTKCGGFAFFFLYPAVEYSTSTICVAEIDGHGGKEMRHQNTEKC